MKGNLFERVPYVLAGAVKSVIGQQTDPQMITLMKGYDYRKVVDNRLRRAAGEGRLLRKAVRARHQSEEEERKASWR